MSRGLLLICIAAAVLGMTVRAAFPTGMHELEPAKFRHLIERR
jgi:hypothetical protein